MKNNSFCKGICCREFDRKFTTIYGEKICGMCAIEIGNNKLISIDDLMASNDRDIILFRNKINNDIKKLWVDRHEV